MYMAEGEVCGVIMVNEIYTHTHPTKTSTAPTANKFLSLVVGMDMLCSNGVLGVTSECRPGFLCF